MLLASLELLQPPQQKLVLLLLPMLPPAKMLLIKIKAPSYNLDSGWSGGGFLLTINYIIKNPMFVLYLFLEQSE